MSDDLLEVRDLEVAFDVRSANGRRQGTVRAVDGVDLRIRPGEIVGLVGESGCGKSTLGRAIMGLESPAAGSVELVASRTGGVAASGGREFRRAVQMVFQDPYSALNPRRRVGDILLEARRIQGNTDRHENRRVVVGLLEAMGFGPEALARYPHQFSGGQLQRIGIARALANDPDLVICDEPVSALDVSIQSQILNLLADLQAERGLAYLFITHDLGVVQYIADRVLVMYLGQIVEELSPEALTESPRHPYTQMLAAAVPGERRQGATSVVRGELPSPLEPPAGCRFNPRCPFAFDACRTTAPPLIELGEGRRVRCHLYSSENSPADSAAEPAPTPQGSKEPS